DFVKAHQHFSDPEWDGEPVDPNADGGEVVIVDPVDDEEGNGKEPGGGGTGPRPPRPAKIKVKLADGKARNIQHMMVTTYWHPDGTPMSAHQFMEMLFGKLPGFFQDESQLRNLWSAPETRAKLLQGLADAGFGGEQLAEMQRIIDANNSDLFDVLAYVAYALPTHSREERAATAKVSISTLFTNRQQAFIEFVLAQYVQVGVEELAIEKLSPLLKLKYQNAIADAIAELGKPEEIARVFAGFQKYLYQGAV
ncbi:MAG TPA: type I restriction-modification enzyme R subunit C-terminal domain-containing protein, partial [Pirellulales bacterium]